MLHFLFFLFLFLPQRFTLHPLRIFHHLLPAHDLFRFIAAYLLAILESSSRSYHTYFLCPSTNSNVVTMPKAGKEKRNAYEESTKVRNSEAWEEKGAAEAAFRAKRAAPQKQVHTPPTSNTTSSDDESLTTTTNTVGKDTEMHMQRYHNSSTDVEKNQALSYIMYPARDKLLLGGTGPFKSADCVLRRIIQAADAILKDMHTSSTNKEKKTACGSKRRFQSRTEGSVLPSSAHIDSKVVAQGASSDVPIHSKRS